MKRLILLTVPAALAGCHAASEGPSAPPAQPAQAAPAACSLEIEFGSYAMGIDQRTLEAVEQILAREPAVSSVTRRAWGREGEVTLCATVRSAPRRDSLFDTISSVFPARPRGPISITSDTGRIFRANNDNP